MFTKCVCPCHLFYIENEINNMDNLDDLLKDYNFRDFEQLVPNVKDRIKLRKKYNDYVSFIFISFKLHDTKIFLYLFNFIYLFYYNIFLEPNIQ